MAALQEGIETGFINRVAPVDGTLHPYVVYVPRAYDPGKAWPLVVFLHGRGERGRDGLVQTEVGLPSAIRRHAERFPCLVLMPQCPDDRHWDGARDIVETAFALTLHTYNVDPRRIYLTGLSMGGYATWHYGAAKPDVFAALMPVCGGGDPADAEALATLPVWAFHGADDAVVPVEESRRMVEAVRAAGGDIQYTEYPDTGHDSWTRAYNDPDAIRWLLRQRRDEPASLPGD